MLNRTRALAFAMTLILILGACGGSTADTEAVVDDSPLATTTQTEAPPETEAPVATTSQTTEADLEFDLTAAVAEYAATIPDGWMLVGSIDDVKAAVESGALLLDVREPAEYAEGHILNAVNIPLRTLGDNLDKLPTDRQIIVYCKSGWRAGLGTSALAMVGFDNVLAYRGSWLEWTDSGEEVVMEPEELVSYGDPDLEPAMVEAVAEFLSTIPDGWLSAGDAQAVSDAIDAGAFILDVREPDEYAEGHLPTAVNIPVRQLGQRYMEIPADANVIHYCKSGWRAVLAVPILHLLGIQGDTAYSGSWLQWTEAGMPTET